jgi:DltD protein
MAKSATARSATPHLVSALIACAIVVGILCGGRLLTIQLEQKTVHWDAPKDFFIKNQGLAFERAAARRPDILLLYGSSELIDPIPNRASDFFSNAPTGFQVCPVGKAGTTSLIILQKLGRTGLGLARPQSCNLTFCKLVFQVCRHARVLCRKFLIACGQGHSLLQFH